MTAGELKRDPKVGPAAVAAQCAVVDPTAIDSKVVDSDVKVVDSEIIAALHRRHGDELRYFILGVVRDHDLAGEVVQTAFARAIELAHTVKQESLKAWLFRVAYNEALAMRRRQAVGERAMRFLAAQPKAGGAGPDAGLLRHETVAAVRRALEGLPSEQRRVVAMRMYEQKRFVEISQELRVPLGTVLSRMQSALKKLRRSLREHEWADGLAEIDSE